MRPSARKRGSANVARAFAGAVRWPTRAALRELARFSIIWFTALALISQLALAALSPNVAALGPDSLALASVCHAIDDAAPVDSQDRAPEHFKWHRLRSCA